MVLPMVVFSTCCGWGALGALILRRQFLPQQTSTSRHLEEDESGCIASLGETLFLL